MQPVKTTTEETPVYPKEMMELLGVTRTFSMNRLIKAGRVPAPDVKISQRVRYWHRSTLRNQGLLPQQGGAA
ncbi:hypothetical protein B9Z51_08865 [Limnohabitans sp. T6-5]|uniref:helix-turn-helix transcriptional regulator n=1 Tax=Limnohabitans sp. T6-5 TaxID=1100724 RepID=UPI000D38C520|nr:hypothetical protein [Limnohabitans sp. T6-5]PUE09031.1 hypothetical protein B9Z51_08865 [Limnohabitans sp. T6-5]